MAHPSVPWQDEAISIATHKANTWIDLSGWSPKYFPANLIQAARTYLQDKVLFGTDFPAITPERWLQDWDRLDFPATVREKIEKTNAIKMLGLDEKKING
jgi:predicted TIM-barrel fold metal-dependent hydrolase